MRSRKDIAAAIGQHPFERQKRSTRETEAMEEAAARCGVQCEVRITPEQVTLTTHDYPDFLIAKQAISELTQLPVYRRL